MQGRRRARTGGDDVGQRWHGDRVVPGHVENHRRKVRVEGRCGVPTKWKGRDFKNSARAMRFLGLAKSVMRASKYELPSPGAAGAMFAAVWSASYWPRGITQVGKGVIDEPSE